MTASNLPVLRGRYPQPHYAMKAQFDATTRYDCTDRLGEIGCPTLVAHGRSDRTAPLALAEEMAERIPDSRIVLFEGGHLFSFAGPRGRLLAEVEAFLGAEFRS